MGDGLGVVVEIDQNMYLPVGGTAVDAIVTVTTSTGSQATAGSRPSRATEIIMIDCSGSMGGGRLRAAKAAANVAIDTLRDGVRFAIIAGTREARLVYPRVGTAEVTPRNRAAAKRAVGALSAGGGTAMGAWLTLANQVFDDDPRTIRHAILLTDGMNEHETPEDFQRALDACAGRFVCDSRGVGREWRATELMRISSALLGGADGMKDPVDLPADFRSIIEAAMGKTTSEITLRVWTPVGARIRFLKQMYPDIVDVTDRRTEVSPRVGTYPTGAWGSESREYHLCVDLEPCEVGEELLAARVQVFEREERLAQGLVEARWTDDATRSTAINRKVAHYSGQDELAEVIQDGLAARDAGDLDRATAKLGRAVALASEHGRQDTARLLARVVDVDPVSGTVRLKSRVDNEEIDIDSEMAKIGTIRTQRLRPQ